MIGLRKDDELKKTNPLPRSSGGSCLPTALAVILNEVKNLCIVLWERLKCNRRVAEVILCGSVVAFTLCVNYLQD